MEGMEASPTPEAPQAESSGENVPRETPEAAQGEGSGETERPAWADSKHKIKVDGQEVELTYDELLAHAQKGRFADKVISDTKQKEKFLTQKEAEFNEALEAKKLLDGLSKRDKNAMIKAFGSKEAATEFAEQLVWEQMQAEQMQKENPDKWEAMQAKKEAEDLKKQIQEREQAENQTRHQQAVNQELTRLDKFVGEILEPTNLPKNARTVARTAQIMESIHDQIDEGRERGEDLSHLLDPVAIREAVELSYREDIQTLLAELPDEVMDQWLPEGLSKRLRQRDIAQLKNPRAEAKRGEPAETRAKGPNVMTPQEFRRKLGMI